MPRVALLIQRQTATCLCTNETNKKYQLTKDQTACRTWQCWMQTPPFHKSLTSSPSCQYYRAPSKGIDISSLNPEPLYQCISFPSGNSGIPWSNRDLVYLWMLADQLILVGRSKGNMHDDDEQESYTLIRENRRIDDHGFISCKGVEDHSSRHCPLIFCIATPRIDNGWGQVGRSTEWRSDRLHFPYLSRIPSHYVLYPGGREGEREVSWARHMHWYYL